MEFNKSNRFNNDNENKTNQNLVHYEGEEIKKSKEHIEYIEKKLEELKSKNYNTDSIGKVIVEENFSSERYSELVNGDMYTIIPAYPKEYNHLIVAHQGYHFDIKDYEKGYVLVPNIICREYSKELFSNLIDSKDKIRDLFRVLFYEHFNTRLSQAIFDYEHNSLHNEIADKEEINKIFEELEDIIVWFNELDNLKGKNLVHYKGEIGEFDYNPNIWSVISNVNKGQWLQLKCKSKVVGKVEIPKGLISYYELFADCKLGEDFTLDNIDTSQVTNMSGMFRHCELPENFSLGNNFDTSKVVDMSSMFAGSNLPENFSLGDKFDTSNVKKMGSMFLNCKLPSSFSLGDKFDTSNVVDMPSMFYGCKMSKNFSLGDKFNTSKVWNMESMFKNCEFPENFSLGNKFNTKNVVVMYSMFSYCNFPNNFLLGDEFDTSNVTDMSFMFYNSKMGKDFSLGNKFNTSKVETMRSMFLNCSIPENFSLGDNFDTYMVKDMSGMFNSCSLPKSFSLGNKFDTSNVKIMSNMFRDCIIPENFSLGDKFSSYSVENFSNMFKDCKMPNSFKEKYKDLILKSQQ